MWQVHQDRISIALDLDDHIVAALNIRTLSGDDASERCLMNMEISTDCNSSWGACGRLRARADVDGTAASGLD